MDCFRNSVDHAEEYLCGSGINKHNAHVVALIAGSTRILVVQKMFQVGGLVFNAHRNRFAKELKQKGLRDRRDVEEQTSIPSRCQQDGF